MTVVTGEPRLVGRDTDLAVIERLVERAPERGGALVVRGDAGIGKTALVDAAADRAAARGMTVLRTAGVQTEGHLPFAGLYGLLRPVLGELGRLPPPQRAAVSAAFGMTDEAAPDVFLISLAALDLLADLASREPLLVVVEDAHWLDTPSASVLAFVARRLDHEPIVLVLALREGAESTVDDGRLPELRLGPLGERDAAAVLDERAPGLAPDVRRRILEEAEGNPLALVELALSGIDRLDATARMTPLPLTERLERAFAARLAELPDETRALLLVAALDDSGAVDSALTAAADLAGREVTLEDLSPAAAAGLVDLDGTGIGFRHPLVRSAVHQSAAVSQRQAAHGALARAHVADPDRSVWHDAAALVAPDDGVADRLEEAATRARRRGAPTVAAVALERSAELTTDPARRGSRFFRAAELVYELGQPEASRRLVRIAQPLAMDPGERTRMALLAEMLDPGAWSGADPIRSHVEVAERLLDAGDVERAIDVLERIAYRCWWANPDRETRDLVVATAERVPVPADHPGVIAILALADPVNRGAATIASISRLAAAAEPSSSDPLSLFLLGAAATAVWAHQLSTVPVTRAIDGFRREGRLGMLAGALVTQAWTGVHQANAAVAVPAAEEGTRLARETGQPRWETSGMLASAAIAAEQGDLARAESLADDAERVLLPMGANPLLSLVQLVRGRTALAGGRHADAFEQVRRIFDPADVAYQPFVRGWVVADLVEAAVHSGNDDEVRPLVEEVEQVAAVVPGPLLHAELGYARAVLAPDDDAEALFQAALASDLGVWPFHRARILLGYGAWLRRARRIADSRAPLRAALEALDALGFAPWSERARQELRASGETSRARAPEAWDRLTPQELQIAQLAATGLSNREIGQRLYLSHRTVGYHLYRIFPKLGITSRSQLEAALGAVSTL